jgi:lysophospholipase L1-like esterase
MARGPFVRPANLVQKKSAVIREFAKRPNVYLVNEHAFDSLERPELFKDGLHLNLQGATLFAPMLVREVGAILGPSRESKP